MSGVKYSQGDLVVDAEVAEFAEAGDMPLRDLSYDVVYDALICQDMSENKPALVFMIFLTLVSTKTRFFFKTSLSMCVC